jgi:L-fuconolactonase
MTADRPTTPRFVDTHLHMWDLERCEYSWLTPEAGVLYATHHVDEVDPERRAAGVDGAILVQAANSRCDTDLMREAMGRHPWVLGVVGWVDLLHGAAAEEDAGELAATGDVVGIRHLIHDEPDPDWVVQPAVIEGLRAVARAGLTYDVVSVRLRHLEHVPTLAAAIPELPLVIDHLSKPPIGSGDLGPWAARLRAAAAHPNVFAKVSGLDTAAGSPDWTPEDLRPAFEIALEAFGASRLMYGGDWPVSKLGGGYTRQASAFARLVGPLSTTEQASIRAGTALAVYGRSLG